MTSPEQTRQPHPSTPLWRKELLVIFLAALALRVGVVAVKWPDPKAILTEFNDSTDYDWLAQSLLRGDGFAAPCGKPTAFRPPLYPIFLATVYAFAGASNLGAVALTQAVLGALAALLASLAARRAGLRDPAALLAGALTALYPAFLFQTPQILTEALGQTLIIALAALLLSAANLQRPILWIAAGILFALATLNKSVLLAALPFLALWIVVLDSRRRNANAALRSLALFIFPVALLVGGWSLRNALVGQGTLIPVSTNFPITFAQGVTRHSYYTKLWYGEARCMPSPDDYLRLTQMRTYCGVDEELRIGHDYEAQARRFIAERPAWFAALTLRKALHFWGPFVRSAPAETLAPPRGPETSGHHNAATPKARKIGAQSAVAFLTMAPVLLGGWIAVLWMLSRRHPASPFAWLALAIAIPITLPHALSQCDVRYRLGLIDPLWIILAAALIDLVRPSKKRAAPILGSQPTDRESHITDSRLQTPNPTLHRLTFVSQRTTDYGQRTTDKTPRATLNPQATNNK